MYGKYVLVVDKVLRLPSYFEALESNAIFDRKWKDLTTYKRGCMHTRAI